MKKFFGICFILGGLLMIIVGIVALTDYYSRSNTFEGRLRSEFSESYRTQDAGQQVIGFVFVIGGVISFIIGLALVSSKSSSQIKKEIELEILKNNQRGQFTAQSASRNQNSNQINQLETLISYRQQGYITQEEFEEQKKKILNQL